jgi:hypothetical protein
MVEPTSRYNRPDVLTTAQQLSRQYIVLDQLKKELARVKFNSPEYKKALAGKADTEKRIADLEKIDKAERSSVSNEKSAKDRAKLSEALQRAEDYGTEDEVTKAQAALDKFDGKNPFVAPGGQSGKGPDVKPADTDGDGIPDSIDAEPKVPAKKPSAPTPGATGGTGGTGGAGAATPGADKVKTAWLGYLETTFKTLPKEFKGQIDKLFVQAKKENWTEVTFTEALKQTSWWQQTLPSLRSFFVETHDPRNASTFAEKLSLNTTNVAASLEKLGIRAQQVDPVTGKVVDNSKTIQGIALDAIKNGWNDTQILQHLGDNAQLLFTGGGTIGSSVDNIRKQALNYGITIDNNYLDTIQRSLLDPTDGRDQQYYLNEMKAQAMDLYKPFASSLKEGRSLYEVTNSYRNQMATLLEVDSTNVTWKDLMAKVVDPTTGNARTFADFNKQVKQDPLWQYTKNAKETYSNTALDLMKQFGFMG